MPEKEHPVVFAVDVCKGLYLPSMMKAAQETKWLLVPYSAEGPARKDINSSVDALILGLSNNDDLPGTLFTGKFLLEDARNVGVPSSVIGAGERLEAAKLASRSSHFIERQEDVVRSLSEWLISLTQKS